MSVKGIVSDAILALGNEREKLIPVLQYVADREKWLSRPRLAEIAAAFGLSEAEVYGVASFYSFLDLEPRGRHIIRVCRTIACDMAGKKAVLQALEDLLQIQLGGTTPDGRFSLLETNCMGWCNQGPAMMVDEDVHTELTPEKAVAIIQGYRDGEAAGAEKGA